MSQKKISHKLRDVTHREFGIQLDKEEQKADWGGDLSQEMLSYASKDSQILLPLYEKLQTGIEDSDLERVTEIEHRALPAMVWMSQMGVPFDAEGWGECLEERQQEKDRLEQELHGLAPEPPSGGIWNWNSPQQVIKAFRLLGIELSNTKEDTLSRCDHPLAKTLLEYRRVSKVVVTYGPLLLERVDDGRFYSSWWQIGAGTGRMSCSKPNLQQLPPEVRNYVRAPEGRVLVSADYSQIELRIAAKISGDERMLEAYREDEDIHKITAQNLTGSEEVSDEERKLAKAVNFGLVFGMQAQSLREDARNKYGVEMSLEEAKRYRRSFFETYPGLKCWHDREYQNLKKHGITETRTLAGRRRTGVYSFTERLNSPIQGTGADGLKLSMALLWERRDECPGAVPILVVHDEIVVECDEGQVEAVKDWLEKAMVDGMDTVLNAPEIEGPHVPVEVEVEAA